MPVTGLMSDYDRERSSELRRARRRATALLVAVGAVFVSTFWMGDATWVGFLRTTAEASVIGGLADWFAVTALFRHPLGIPIPHTAIIPRSKTGLARSLGQFVEHNFLSPDQFLERVEALQPVQRLGEWLIEEANAGSAANQLSRIAQQFMEGIDRDSLAAQAGDTAGRLLQHPALTAGLGRALAAALSAGQHHPTVEGAIRGASSLLVEQESTLRSRMRQESPWWVPEAVDDAVFDKAREAVLAFLAEVASNRDHEVRKAIDARLRDIADRLQDDSDLARRVSSAVAGLTQSHEFRRSLAELVERTLRDLSRPDRVTLGLQAVGRRLLEDEDLRSRLDGWMQTLAPSVARVGRRELADLIATTIERWDPNDTSRRLELWMGKDLQFVRINGTVVGGLAGLAIHTAVFLLGG